MDEPLYVYRLTRFWNGAMDIADADLVLGFFPDNRVSIQMSVNSGWGGYHQENDYVYIDDLSLSKLTSVESRVMEAERAFAKEIGCMLGQLGDHKLTIHRKNMLMVLHKQ